MKNDKRKGVLFFVGLKLSMVVGAVRMVRLKRV